ncbi:MAG TPA: diguanylate cyclase [Lachnospiraceae bacterium]|nr:diguanylate cyclase [Lachnospiraceae bacterium]
MEVYLRIDINLVAMALLGSILLIAYKRLNMQDNLNHAYIKLGLIIFMELFFETSTCIINKREELSLIPLSYLLHICLFTMAPILSFHGYQLIIKLILPNRELSKKCRAILVVPVAVNAILTIVSVRYHFIFYINESNFYHRGPYFNVFAIITYFYIVLSFILIVRNRSNIINREFIPLLLFSLFPMIGGVVQTIFYGPLLMWSSNAYAFVILYVFLQQRMVHLDDLTGAWSRGSFDHFITNCLTQTRSKNVGIIYCDIDDFKSINDQFGHIEGDRAIKTTTKLIKSAISKKDIIVRMGGDEFIVIINSEPDGGLEKVLDCIKAAFLHYNETSNKGYKLECSFGADTLNLSYKTIEEFLNHVDSLMYENKRSKKDARMLLNASSN